MKYLHPLIVFLLTASLYAQTPTTVLDEIELLSAPIAFHGDDLYYVSDNDHVYKIDLNEADPTPQAVISTDTDDSAGIYDLAFHGDVLYLSMSDAVDTLTEILRVDLTASTLVVEKVVSFATISSPIAFLGDDLYLVTTALLKLDVTVADPMSEVVMTSLPEDNPSNTFSDFTFHDNMLYMASNGVHRVDVTAENPDYEKIVESGQVVGIALSGNSLYFDREANKIQRIQDVNGGTLKGTDLVTSVISTMGQLAIHNNHLYIADTGTNKIIKYPLKPFEAIYELDQPLAVHGDDLYYVSDDDHIYKIDLSAENPTAEAVVSFPNEEESGNHNYSITSLAYHGDRLYVSESDITNEDKISRIDITTDPPSIEELYQTDSFSYTPIAFLGNHIYFVNLTDDDSGDQYQLLKLDVTAQAPTPEVVMTLTNGAEAMAFHGNDLYVSPATSSGITYRVDVTAETPMIEELSDLGSGIREVVFEGNSLYYSFGSNSVSVAQDVNSGAIERVDVVTEGLDSAYGVAIHNNHLYIADTGTDKIVIHELPAPPPPVQIWDGADLTFTKPSSADWTQDAHQDRITDNVWITRQNSKPIYNYKWWQDHFSTDATADDISFDFSADGESPTQSFTATGGTKGLRWAILDDTGATTDNWDNFTMYGSLGNPEHFYSFSNIATIVELLNGETEVTINSVVDNFSVSKTDHEGTSDESSGVPKNLVGKNLGVWIEDENIYLTLTFNSWSGGDGEGNSNGGGFSYTRSTDGSLSIDNPKTSSKIILAPNPVRDRMYIYGVNNPTAYHIYNLLGREVAHGRVSEGGAVEVALLPRGLYLLKFQNGNAIKFVKE